MTRAWGGGTAQVTCRTHLIRISSNLISKKIATLLKLLKEVLPRLLVPDEKRSGPRKSPSESPALELPSRPIRGTNCLAPPLIRQTDTDQRLPMKQISGVITAVQEGRFRLASHRGQNKLFVLSHKAPVAAQDLAPLQREEIDVTVHYDEAPDLIAGVVYDITPFRPA